MNENKYYTPEIEDFRVGYEYEFNGEGLQLVIVNLSDNESFQPIGEVKEVCERRIFRGTDWDIMFPITEGLKANRIRVPYLTKEQIEAEGWECIGKSIDTWFEKKGVYERSSWTSYKAIIHYGFHDKLMTIVLDDPPSTETIFLGECKSINELRYICKLLKI